MGQTFKDQLIHGMTIRESATDGSDFTNAPSDYRRLFLGEDGLLYLKDSAGAVTSIGADLSSHTGDTSDAHDASAISVLDTAGNFTGTDVEAVLAELQDNIDGVSGSGAVIGWGIRHSSNQAFSTSGVGAIPCDTEEWDTDAFHFSSNANLTGTVAKVSGSANIVGTGTSFTTELSVGQVISIPGTSEQRFAVKAITDNTHLEAWQTASASASGQTAQRRSSCISIPLGLGGRYVLGISSTLSAGPTQADLYLTKGGNGSSTVPLIARCQPAPVFSSPWLSASREVALVEGDILELGSLANTGVNVVATSGLAWFTGRKVA